MAKIVKIGLLTIQAKNGIDFSTWKVRIIEEYSDGRVLISPIGIVGGEAVRIKHFVRDKGEVKGVIEKSVSNWKYFWGTY